MNNIIKNINPRNSTLIIITIIAAFFRLIPVMPNFSPLGAAALFGAAHFSKKYQAVIVPLFAVWLSDLFINNILYRDLFPGLTLFYGGFYWQYGSYLLISLGGIYIFDKVTIPRIFTASLSASVLFFIVSNFGCWFASPLYPQNIEGLIACYTAGIPFFKGTLLGNLFYSAIIFSSFYALQMLYPALKPLPHENQHII